MARETTRERPATREESQAVEPRKHGRLSRMESRPWQGPFTMMRRLADDMDRLFEGFGFPRMELAPWGFGEHFTPKIDIFEKEGKLVITADLPGLNKDDVRVDITEDAVLIEGERKSEYEETEEGVYRRERTYGHFSREVPLPEGVKTDTASATFKNGVLEVTIEAPQLTRSRRRIEIEEEETGVKPEESAA